ncbi:MAG TPA: family 1 encapsulin nanocompartment shell protein [Streptosporangiaceae bacterium]|nr:family 1 encapsulin nanocompartment shell protein [Streptosporangiaceae bacterium]
MNNLHRELAPVSDEAWAQIEQETARTLKRYLAGRRVVDVSGPGGVALSAVGTGHLTSIDPPADGVQARQRQVLPLVELRVPFALNREQIDDVLRGSQDSDWQPARDAARQIAFAEDRAIFAGYPAAGIGGIVPGASNAPVSLPADIAAYPVAFAQAANQLREAGVDGPYTAVLSAEAYTAVSEASDQGYPVIRHLRNVLDGELIWAPAISGAVLVTARGGDFSLHLGQDFSIGYLSHNDAEVTLYLQEAFTFQLITQEAAVSLTPAR